MRDRSQQILRLLCWVLLALLAVELVHAVFRSNPLAHVVIPAIPTLETNAATASKHDLEKPAASKHTTPKPATPSAKPAEKSSAPKTNAVVQTEPDTDKTNATVKASADTGQTNSVSTTNSVVAVAGAATNAASTNVSQITPSETNSAGSNVVVTSLAKTNLTQVSTNQSAGTGSNAVASAKHSEKHAPHLPPGMTIPGGVHFAGGSMPMMPGMHGHGAKLSADVQARVDEIVSSEILAPVMHPLPMGLLGIAGDYAFLRADSGQTGVVKIGEKVGDIKLLRIGINRVLIEQDGKQKELTIFNGYGGESLLNQTNDISK